MSVAAFNAIEYFNRLHEAGVDDKVASIHAEEISNIINNQLATKKDLELLKSELVVKLGSLVAGSSFLISVVLGVIAILNKA